MIGKRNDCCHDATVRQLGSRRSPCRSRRECQGPRQHEPAAQWQTQKKRKPKPAQLDFGYRRAADFTQHSRRCIGCRNLRDFDQPLFECLQFEVEGVSSSCHRKSLPQCRLLGTTGAGHGGQNGRRRSRVGNRLALVPEPRKTFHGDAPFGRLGSEIMPAARAWATPRLANFASRK